MTQCFPGGTLVHYADLGAIYERWHQGPYQHLVLDDGTELACTRNHPVVTHLGWKAAWEIERGYYVLTVAASPDVGEAIDAVFHYATQTVHTLPGSPQDFHGDGSTGTIRAVSTGGLISASPWRASEGAIPRVPSTQLYEVLALTIQPNALGYSNWSEVRRHVPDVDKMWPGRPYAMDESLGANIAAELPPPVVDHDAWARKIVGVPGKLALHRVDHVETRIAGSYVYNLSVATGAYLAAGVVVGNCG